jgi:hypothetical protein
LYKSPPRYLSFGDVFRNVPIPLDERISADTRGNVESGRVRRYFYLPRTADFNEEALVADLQEIFVVPRQAFGVHFDVDEASGENRLMAGTAEYDDRLTSLDDEGCDELRVHIGTFFDLRLPQPY